ncbi:hypothetical protein Bbelb_301860 [Branchiostoma belcheri]|nr:hypothetical protein Bbelb_301860 [Branchiostoma belcheri]
MLYYHERQFLGVVWTSNFREAACPAGYEDGEYEGRCFKRVACQTCKTSYQEARDECALIGGHIVTVQTEEKYNFLIRKDSHRAFWIGLDDIQTEGSFVWNDGLPLGSLAPWNASVQNSDDRDCVAMGRETQFKWLHMDCNYRLRYLCETDAIPDLPVIQPVTKATINPQPAAETTPTPSVNGLTTPQATSAGSVGGSDQGSDGSQKTPTSVCPANYDDGRFDKYCFRRIDCQGCRNTYQHARADCANDGGRLVQDITQEKYDYLVKEDLLKIYWIGLTDVAVEGTFVWEYGAPLGSFQPWDPSLPNTEAADCVAIVRDHNFAWARLDCNTGLRYLCEKQAIPASEQPASTPSSNVIPAVNECAESSPCDANAACTDTPDGFTCRCDSGYRGDGFTCSDVNECSVGTPPCDSNADCTNTDGSYTCRCRPGYQGDGRTCTPGTDGCTLANTPCDANADCVNDGGSFTCRCRAGYAGNGLSCSDVNECSASTPPCDSRAVCTNTDGSFTCSCPPGYHGNGFHCTDIDECSDTDTPPCDQSADCRNTVGSYVCTCRAGYHGNGQTCADINECAASTSPCGAHAHCTNTAGSFVCRCNAGYQGDGRTCRDVNECTTSTPCDANAACTNTIGSFQCTCRQGYQGDGRTCADINECIAPPCGANAQCTNTAGSFACSCLAGYQGDGKTCRDVDECATSSPCDSNADCSNIAGSFQCSCRDGYIGDGISCAADVSVVADGTGSGSGSPISGSGPTKSPTGLGTVGLVALLASLAALLLVFMCGLILCWAKRRRRTTPKKYYVQEPIRDIRLKDADTMYNPGMPKGTPPPPRKSAHSSRAGSLENLDV